MAASVIWDEPYETAGERRQSPARTRNGKRGLAPERTKHQTGGV